MPNHYRFGRFEAQLAERRLLMDGVPVELGARAFDLLVCLIEQRHRTVSKSALLDAVWPGLVVEENNLSVQVSSLRKILGAKSIATIPAQGYRFAMELVSVDARERVVSPETDHSESKPTIAVLPFRVLSKAQRAGFLADGLAEDVIALLARVPGFIVISSASSFVFRGNGISLAEVAQQLGVRYVVGGSVRLLSDRVRVSTQLTQAQSGHLLWSGRFECEMGALDDLQDSITRGIITELEPQLNRAEIALIRRQRPENINAWGHYRQAIGVLGLQGWREEAIIEARSELTKALTNDPAFGLAHAELALLTALSISTGLMAPTDDLVRGALESSERAISLDDGSSGVVGRAACALCDLGKTDRGAEMLRRAIEMDPSNAQAHVALGATIARSGKLMEGIGMMRYGIRISPKDRRLGFWAWALGACLMATKQPEAALLEARAANRHDPRLHLSRILEAVALQALGRIEEAGMALATARQLRRHLSLEEVGRSHGRRIAEKLEPLWGKSV